MLRGYVVLLTVSGLAMGQAMVQHAAAAAGGAAAAAGSKKVADSLEKMLGSAASATAAAAGTPATAAVPPPAAAAPAPATGKRNKPSPYEPRVNRAGGTEMAPVLTPGGSRQPAVPSPSDVEATVEATVSGESVPGNSWVSRKPHQQVPAFTPFVTNDAPAVSRGSRRNSSSGAAAAQFSETAIISPVAMPPSVPASMITTAIVPPPPERVVATVEKLAALQEGSTLETVLASLGTPAAKIEMVEDGKVLETLRIESLGNKIGTIRMVNGLVTSIEPVAR